MIKNVKVCVFSLVVLFGSAIPSWCVAQLSEIPEHVQNEVDSCVTAFHSNRLVESRCTVLLRGHESYIDLANPAESSVTDRKQICSFMPGEDGIGLKKRVDCNSSAVRDGVVQNSRHWDSQIHIGGKRYVFESDRWLDESELRVEHRFKGLAIDPWCISVAMQGSIARRNVTEDYFDKLTVRDRLVQASLDKSNVYGVWWTSKRNAKVAIRFNRESRMPVEMRCLGQRKVVGGGLDGKSEWYVIGMTRTEWKKNIDKRWTPVRVALIEEGVEWRRHLEFDLEWTFGRGVESSWFNPDLAPSGEELFVSAAL